MFVLFHNIQSRILTILDIYRQSTQNQLQHNNDNHVFNSVGSFLADTNLEYSNLESIQKHSQT